MKYLSGLLVVLFLVIASVPAIAQDEIVGIVNTGANLRSGPGTNYKIIGKAVKGQEIVVSGENSQKTWYHLATGEWIAKFLVDIISQDQPSPSRVQPTPTPNCDPSYPDFCLAPGTPDLDCGEIQWRRFRVYPPDRHWFDGDEDGMGCE